MADSYSSRRKSLDRRQRLMDAMMGNVQAPGPGQMVGGHFVPTGLLGALTPAAQILAGGYAQGKMDEESKALDQERTQILRNALENAKNQSAGDRIQTLMGSEIPELQQMGMKAFEAEIAPSKPETFGGLTTVIGPDGKPMLVQAGNRGSIKRQEGMMPFERPMAVRGELINPLTRQSYGMFGQAQEGAKTIINMPGELTADEDYAKQLAKERGKSDSATVDSLQSNDAIDNYLNGIQTVLNEGAVTGGAANTLAGFNKLLTTFGIEISPELSNTEEGRRQLKAQLADRLSGGDASRLTDKDLQVISDSADIISSPNPQKALDNMRKSNRLSRLGKKRQLERSKSYFQDVKAPSKLGSEEGPVAIPRIGEVQDGYQFMGGDPSNPASWRKK